MSRKLPLVVILGATGSGKTRLSLELAQKLTGEIIGADSMQVYKELDIITAKATKEEQKLVPHHLIDILEPHEACSVMQYRNRAVKIIDSLFDKNSLPIIVGGTNYYIESLLWKILISNPNKDPEILPRIISDGDRELPPEELHKRLQSIDPKMAKRIHPNNSRKIIRSLEVFYQTGRKLSEILLEQQQSSGGSEYGGGLRYSNALIFQLQCDKDVLDDRLNKRVDGMIKEGLVEELTNFHHLYNKSRTDDINPDYTKGIFQSIGLKEFHSYLIMDEDARSSEDGQKLLLECIEELKMVTRRYAKRQNKWIRNRFLANHGREVPPIYGLDVTDVSQWNDKVLNPALDVIESYILDQECTLKPLPRIDSTTSANASAESYFCDTCERVFVGLFQWTEHQNSSRHKRTLARKNKEAKRQKLEEPS